MRPQLDVEPDVATAAAGAALVGFAGVGYGTALANAVAEHWVAGYVAEVPGSARPGDGANRGAPGVPQVADRWHLLHVRREALIDRVGVRDRHRRSVAAGR